MEKFYLWSKLVAKLVKVSLRFLNTYDKSKSSLPIMEIQFIHIECIFIRDVKHSIISMGGGRGNGRFFVAARGDQQLREIAMWECVAMIGSLNRFRD